MRAMNIWVAQVSLRDRKTCPSCRTKLIADNCIVGVGYYHSARYHSLFYACKVCFDCRLAAHVIDGTYKLCYRSGQVRIAWVEQFKEEHAVASDSY